MPGQINPQEMGPNGPVRMPMGGMPGQRPMGPGMPPSQMQAGYASPQGQHGMPGMSGPGQHMPGGPQQHQGMPPGQHGMPPGGPGQHGMPPGGPHPMSGHAGGGP